MLTIGKYVLFYSQSTIFTEWIEDIFCIDANINTLAETFDVEGGSLHITVNKQTPTEIVSAKKLKAFFVD